jgi:hypothetical protein
MLSCI